MLSHAAARASHLCFPLLQEGLEPLLSSPPLVVVAHYQDDVVPVELAHQVEPHMRLVGVGRDCPQEGQMDALRSAEREMEVNTVRLNTVSTTAILCWRGSKSHRVVAHNQAEKNCVFSYWYVHDVVASMWTPLSTGTDLCDLLTFTWQSPLVTIVMTIMSPLVNKVVSIVPVVTQKLKAENDLFLYFQFHFLCVSSLFSSFSFPPYLSCISLISIVLFSVYLPQAAFPQHLHCISFVSQALLLVFLQPTAPSPVLVFFHSLPLFFTSLPHVRLCLPVPCVLWSCLPFFCIWAHLVCSHHDRNKVSDYWDFETALMTYNLTRQKNQWPKTPLGIGN